MNKKKILITGGLGFIGKSLTVKLSKDLYDVYIFDDKRLGKLDKYTENCNIIEGDVANKNDWETIPKCDFVFHFAAPSSIILFNKDFENCVNDTIVGLINCFNWAIKNSCKKVIYPSSGSIFSNTNKPCNEDTTPNPINTYGKTKLACEEISNIYSGLIKSVGLRIFAGYGPQEDHKGEIGSVISLFINSAIKNESPIIYGDGTQIRDFVYIDDITDALIALIDNEDDINILNIGSGSSTSFNRILEIINNLLGKKIEPTYVKKPKNYLEETSCDPSSLTKIINRQPTTIEEGIKRYIKAINEK